MKELLILGDKIEYSDLIQRAQKGMGRHQRIPESIINEIASKNNFKVEIRNSIRPGRKIFIYRKQ
jgi:hypothetical protein